MRLSSCRLCTTIRSLLLVLLLALVAGCAPAAAPVAQTTRTAVSGEVLVFAAASLTDAFKEMGATFEQANPGTRVTFNFGASSALRTQLEQGARADVFASADQAQMDNARQAGLVIGEDRVFVRNRLTIITPRDNPRGITDVKDLGAEGLKLVTTQPHVPIGQYTAAMLDKAANDPTSGADFKARVEKNTVSREDNVRQVVAKVQLGEADAGVVYSSDVTPQVREQLQQVAVPDALNTLASYPIAVTRGGNEAGGRAFVQFVLSPQGQEALARWGFVKAGG